MFDIEFTADAPEPQEDGWVSLCGRITLGDYRERFLAPINFWQREDYERQWLEAARRILGESDRTGFFTTPYEFWWTMWRSGDRVYVHEEVITDERYAGPYDGSAPYHIIADRVTHTEEGQPVSEWEITLDDVRGFVERRQRPAVPA